MRARSFPGVGFGAVMAKAKKVTVGHSLSRLPCLLPQVLLGACAPLLLAFMTVLQCRLLFLAPRSKVDSQALHVLCYQTHCVKELDGSPQPCVATTCCVDQAIAHPETR